MVVPQHKMSTAMKYSTVWIDLERVGWTVGAPPTRATAGRDDRLIHDRRSA